jgi:adenine/guanine phosphoribosyltransferase-like PRPP-binding protein
LRSHAKQVDFECQEIRQLVPLVEKTLRKVRHAVKDRRYAFIVGEDTSGRIPTLMLAGAINGYYVSRNQPKIPVLFITGSKDRYDQAAQRKEMERWKPVLAHVDRSKRVLIVSDLVGNGATTAQIGKLLEAEGFKFDVAAVAFHADMPRPLQFKPQKWSKGSRLYQGRRTMWRERAVVYDTIWHRADLSGMNRNKFSKQRVLRDAKTRRIVAQVRRDIKALTPGLIRVIG